MHVVTKELARPATEQSSGMQRGEAFAHDGVWAGVAGGAQAADVHAGDFVHIPAHLVHRETLGGTAVPVSSCARAATDQPSPTSMALTNAQTPRSQVGPWCSRS
jgi:hypothetical protein